MGYCHYYDVDGWYSWEWQDVWPHLVRDVSLILEASDMLICGPCDEDQDQDLVLPIVSVEEGILFNGVGDDGHEYFVLSAEEHHGRCKTQKKPYGVAVACVLLRAQSYAPERVRIRSDGKWVAQDWITARRLYQDLWPQHLLRCPWDGVDGYVDTSRESVTWDIVMAAANVDKQSLEKATPNGVITIIKALETFGLTSFPMAMSPATEVTVSQVDFGHMRQWLSRCEADIVHAECVAAPVKWQYLPGTRFKVVDLHRGCVVEAPENCSFVALSYVWGGVDHYD